MTPENIGQDEIEEEPTKKVKNGTLNVLIVDDEKYIRDLLADLVRHNAHESETAVDGEDALVKLSQKRFDVVLTDIKMPRLDGYNLLKKVKEKHPETAVVVMTGYSQERIPEQTFPYGRSLDGNRTGALAQSGETQGGELLSN